LYYSQENFIARVSIRIFTATKVMILNRKFLKFEIDLDFVLIAVTTSLKDYRICYLINKYLKFNFVKIPDLAVNLDEGTVKSLFSIYNYHWEATKTDLYFIANKGTEGYLVPEMRKMDYFLLIKNYLSENDSNEIISSLNKIPEIMTAVKIDPKKIKSHENLLF
jgi:hypothetical protein